MEERGHDAHGLSAILGREGHIRRFRRGQALFTEGDRARLDRRLRWPSPTPTPRRLFGQPTQDGVAVTWSRSPAMPSGDPEPGA